jgi:hypothetical protein
MRLKYAVLAATLVILVGSARADVELSIMGNAGAPLLYEPGRLGAIGFIVRNGGDSNVEAAITATLPHGATLVGFNAGFSGNSGNLRCAQNDKDEVVCFQTIKGHGETFTDTLTFATPDDENGQDFISHLAIFSAENDPVPANNTTTIRFTIYRTFTATNGDDGGPGSLRDAITSANARCGQALPCKIRFAGVTTIRPRAPLPVVTGCNLVIDGGTPFSTDFTGPRAVELVGDDAGPSNGLMLATPCKWPDGVTVTVTGLAIHGFAFNGIAVTGAGAQLTQNFIGTDRSGKEARPNGWRGIAVESDAQVTMLQNEISGNRYSGVAVWNGSVYAGLNRIGLAADDSPLGNGASGLFTANGVLTTFNNSIGWNHDAGIGTVAKGGRVVLSADRFVGNGGLPIDWYVDGPTVSDANGKMPPVSTVTDAYYDPATGFTTVNGVCGLGFPSFVSFYLVSPTGETKYVGKTEDVQGPTHAFHGAVRGDFRGQSMAAATQRRTFADGIVEATSELSVPVEVH